MEKPQRAIGADEPVMIAWTRHKASEEHENTLRWAGQSNEANLWASFVAGYVAGGGHTSAEVATIAGELINIDSSAFALDHQDLVEKVRKLAACALGQRQ